MFKKLKITQNKRKKIFINKEVQGRILWRCVVFWAIYHFILLHTLFGFEFMAYLVSIMNGGSVQSFSDLYLTFISKYYPIILTALSLLPFLALDLVKMSHRIVGPFVPFQRAVKDLKAGRKVEEIKLREGDLMTEFQNDFNDFLRWYNKEKLGEASEDSSTICNTELEESIVNEVESLREQANMVEVVEDLPETSCQFQGGQSEEFRQKSGN